MRTRPVREYAAFTDDFELGGKDYTLPADYRWVRTDLGSRLLSGVIYGASTGVSPSAV